MWDDDNDEELLRALEESRRTYADEENLRLSQHTRATSLVTSDESAYPGPSTSAQTSTSQNTSRVPLCPNDEGEDEELYDGAEAEGFSFKAGKIWVYPTSDKFPIRIYQKSIVETALFHNTLVSLPTGLGKTFIAAVVMYNFYMWYPNGKIIFMAPTKPLVAQQIENCINIMGIPESDTAEMTGAMHSKIRAGIWREKRVFFLTPQVVQNDLSGNICPANAVKCVVIDEAHRALGDHAYAQVIRLLNSFEARFRVLALSATPGSDLEAVQKVVSNLMISHMELKSEDDPDVAKYTHQRNLELMVVDVGPTINNIRVKFLGIAAQYAQPLQQRKLLFGNVGSIAKFTVLREWESFRREKSNSLDPATLNRINCDFATVHTLLHGLELLQTYGLRLLLNHLKGAIEKKDLTANRLSVNEDLQALMEEVEGVLNPIVLDGVEENEEGKQKRYIYGHPKLDRLQEVIVSHFETFQQKAEATRAIVFCEYREGVIEICEMLKNFQPLVKPVAFMGQSAGKSSKGISQKQQLEIMEKFKSGKFNTLISTSVGEEGLDIGEVDLIICFDAKNSPIRQVQRMGRTGRKREGRIIMLLTRGKEEQKYNQGLFKKKNVRTVMMNKDNLANHLLQESPRMLPPGVEPRCTEKKIVLALNKKPKSNQQDLRKMFKKCTAGKSAGTAKQGTTNRPSLGKLPFLSENDLEELKPTWNINECCKFDRIPERAEFWAKSRDEIGTVTMPQNNIDFGTYIEFMRYQQRTHVVENSSDSKLLSDLLLWADDRRDNGGAFSGGLSSQVTSSQIWPAKAQKRGRAPVSESKENPPKKRGRPRKNAPPIPLFPAWKSRDNAGVNSDQPNHQPAKHKSKPLFIEDGEDLPVKLSSERPPSPVFVHPTLNTVSPKLNVKSLVPETNVIVLDSDDEDDFNMSTSSHLSLLSSQPSHQELYRELARLLRGQPDEEENECIVCDTLFPCKSFNMLVLERKGKETEKTWKDVNKSLEEALTFVPHLTYESLSKYRKPDISSQRFVSLMPGLEIAADDEMVDGLLCGGMGDLSLPRSISSPKRLFSPLQYRLENSPTEVSHGNINLDAGYPAMGKLSPPCSTPKKGADDEKDFLIQNKFEDASFDLLELFQSDDVFGSQKVKDEVDDKALALKEDLKHPPPSKSPKEHVGNDLKSDMNTMKCDVPKASEEIDTSNHEPSTSRKPRESILEEEKLLKINITPPKSSSAVMEQVSPVLGSQISKTLRSGFQPCKFSDQNQTARSSAQTVNANNTMKDPGSIDIVKNSVSRNLSPDIEVTSSSPLNPGNKQINPFAVDFDLFDDSLFPLSNESIDEKSEVGDSIKEAIRKKALEIKAKQSEESFTQEINRMCETGLGGLTQVMEIFDNKFSVDELQIERADSSSSPQQVRRCSSPITSSGNELNAAKLGNESAVFSTSEEDLFADCDDSLFCLVDSTVSAAKNPPAIYENEALPNCDGAGPGHIARKCSQEKLENFINDGDNINQKSGKIRSPSPISKPSTRGDRINEPSVEIRDNEDDVVQNSSEMRCPSPIFKPSQITKRPSKLSLRKKAEAAAHVGVLNKNIEMEVPNQISENQEEKISKPSELKKSGYNSEIDFSLFGDEFNKSWLYFEEETNDVSKIKGIDKFNSQLNAGPEEDSVKSFEENNVRGGQSIKNARDSSPDNELEHAFALLDEKRKQQKMSSEIALSSTPKGNKFVSKLQREQGNKPNNSSRSETKGLFTLKNKVGLKNWQSPSFERGLQNNQFTTIFRNPPSSGSSCRKSPYKKKPVLNLSSFCDDSLLIDLDAEEQGENFRDVLGTNKLKSAANSGTKCESTTSFEMRMNMMQDEEPNIKKKLSLGKIKSATFLDKGEPTKEPISVASSANQNTEFDSDVIELSSSTDDESLVHNPKKNKKCTLNVTSSSEEGLHIAIVQGNTALNKKRKAVLDSSSSSESFVKKRIKTSKRDERSDEQLDKNKPFDLSTFCDESLLDALVDDEEDGVSKVTKTKIPVHTLSSSDEDNHDFVQRGGKKSKAKTKSRRKKKTSKKRNGFIMSEAEESDNGLRSSSDGETTSLDELDSSFINDSQPDASQSVVDIHHEYLQAVRSPATALGKFKIPSNLPQMTLDVYSQYPDQSELDQTYADDSFCVDNEPTQYNLEMSLLEIAEARLKDERREKRKLKKALKYDDHPVKRKNKQESSSSEEEIRGKRKQLKRIKILEDTLSDDDGDVQEALTASCIKEKGSVPTDTTQEPLSSRNYPDLEENNDLKDLALLLDDDLDFSNIPDFIPEAVKKYNPPPQTDKTSKIVMKTPFTSRDESKKGNFSGSCNIRENPAFAQTLQNSRGAANLNAAPNISEISSHIPAPELKQAPKSSACSSKVKAANAGPLSRIFIIASSRQIASSPDVLRILRVSYHIVIVPHAVPDADFILSWRVGVSRVFASDLKDRKKLQEIVKKLKGSYSKPHIIIQKDQIKSLAGFQKIGKKSKGAISASTSNPAPSSQSPWSTAVTCTNAALLRQAGVHLLFSKNYDETAGFLAKLARKENNEGHGIPETAQNVSDEVETRLQFLVALPSINYAFALKLSTKFTTLSDFFARCSSVCEIASTLGIDVNAARKIHHLLCEVHVSP